MTRIEVYDIDAMRIEILADKYDTTISEIIEMMLDNIDKSEEDYVFK